MELVHKIEWEENGEMQSLVIDEPIGFDNLEVSLERHEFHGIGAEVSLGDLEFYGEAAEVITRVYESDIDNEIWYEVSEPIGQRWLIDLSTYKRTDGNYSSVSCKVCEEGIKTIFNNRTDIDIDLQTLNSIDGTDIQAAQWKSVAIPTKHLLFTNISKRNINETYTNGSEGLYIGYNAKYFSVPVGNNITSEFGTLQEVETAYAVNSVYSITPQYTPDEKHEDKYGKNTTARVQIHLLGQMTVMSTILNSADNFTIQLVAEDTYGNTISGDQITINKSFVATPGATISFDMQLFGGLNAYEEIRYYLLFGFAGQDAITAYITINKDSMVKMTMYDKIEDVGTRTSVIMVYDALSIVTRAISDSAMNVISEWYTYQGKPGGGALKCLTNGYKIRALYSDGDNNRNIPLSFKSLITSLNALDCVGWGFYNDNVRVERWDWFYKDDVILDINGANEITTETNTSQMITELTIGYKKFATTSQYNSIDSPHGTRVFASNNKVVHEALTKECEFIADNYAIEETRRSRTMKSETEETTYDENIFVLELTKTGDVFNVQNTSIGMTGMNKPDEFINAKLTPRHMAARWRDYIFQSTSKSALRFMSGEINYSVSFNVIPEEATEDGVTTYSLKNFTSGTQKENADIEREVSLIKAENVSFSYPITLEEYKAIKANPYGIVRINGKDCWIKSFKYSFADSTAEFKLIPKAK